MYYIEKKFNNLYSKNKYDILQGIIKCKTEIIIKDNIIILTILFGIKDIKIAFKDPVVIKKDTQKAFKTVVIAINVAIKIEAKEITETIIIIRIEIAAKEIADITIKEIADIIVREFQNNIFLKIKILANIILMIKILVKIILKIKTLNIKILWIKTLNIKIQTKVYILEKFYKL